MSIRPDIQKLLIRYSPWVALGLLPLFLNGLIWKNFTLPSQVALREWRDKQRLIQLKPELARLSEQSQPIIDEWQETGFVKEDPSASVQMIQKLADRHRIEIQQIHLKDQQTEKSSSNQKELTIPGFSIGHLHVEVKGSFDKLARWISDVEVEKYLILESWNLESSKNAAEGHLLTAEIAVLLKEDTNNANLGDVTSLEYEKMMQGLSHKIQRYQNLRQQNQQGYDVVFRRDSMQSLIDSNGKIVIPQGLNNTLVVQGIIYSKDLNLVLINDQFYHPGDTVGSYKILEVRADGVSVQQEGKTLFIPLYPDLGVVEQGVR